MAALCAAPREQGIREDMFCRQRTLSISKVGLDSKVQRLGSGSNVRDIPEIYATRAGWRYHTALLEEEGKAFTKQPALTRTQNYLDALQEASALVAELLNQLTVLPPAYTGLSPSDNVVDAPPPYCPSEELARVHVEVNSAVQSERPRSIEGTKTRRSTMSFQINFGDTSGFQTRGRKAGKKKAAPAAAKWFDDEDDKKDNGTTEQGDKNGSGAGGGGDGGATGGSGGDDNGNGNGGGDDDDEWNFDGSGKKSKTKKTKKQEEEEERKKKEEEEAAAAAATDNADPLSWADDANAGGSDDGWTTGFTKAKDKKKKKGAGDPPPAVPDPPAAAGFQDISLDDTVPKLDFTFDAGDSKKVDTGFGSWGKTWDFGSIVVDEKKKEDKNSTTEFGDNNPWSVGGNKSKKKTTTTSDFDFGNFEASNDIAFETGDIGDTKAADNAWGFSTINKKDKKKTDKKDEPTPDPVAEKDDSTWGAWGNAAKSKKSTTTKKGIDKPVEENPKPGPEADAFDWGFDSKKDKKKSLISDITEEPVVETSLVDNGDDDWLNSGWGAANKKKDKKTKKGADDLSASVDLMSNNDVKTSTGDPAGDDIWATLTIGKKDKKKGDVPVAPPAVPDPPSAVTTDIWGSFGKKDKKSKGGKVISPEPVLSEDLEAEFEPEPEPEQEWDYGLSPKEKRKKRKDMEAQGIKFDAFDKPIYSEPDPPAEPELEPEPVLEEETELPWDHGLNGKEKKKKRKEMESQGIKFDVSGDPIYPEPEPIAKPEPEPVTEEEPKKPWDFGLNVKEKRKKRKDMEAEGVLFDSAGNPTYPEPEPTPDSLVEPESALEPLAKEEPKKPWDQGLSPREKKKKRKEMEAEGIEFDSFGDPIYPKPEPVAEPEPEPAVEEEPRQPWDLGLSPKEKRKKRKEMEAEGIKFDEFGEPIYPKPEPVPESIVEPEPELVVEEKSRPPWDLGLSPKEKRKKRKDMEAEGIKFDEFGEPIYPKPDLTSEPLAETESKSVLELVEEKEPEQPWDFGLSSKDKKKKKKEMQAQGITFDAFDQPIYPDLDPIPEPETQHELEQDAVADKEPEIPWDQGLSAKDKKKKKKEMMAQGIVFDDFDQPIHPKAEVTEPEPAPIPEKEPELPWDHGLSSKEKRKKKKDMEAQGIMFDAFDQPIYPDPEPLVEEVELGLELEDEYQPDPITEEPELPWDHGLNAKERKKKRKEMEAEGIKFDVAGQPIYPEPEPAPAPVSAEVEAEELVEPEPESAKEPEKRWDHGLSPKEKRRKRKEMEAEGIEFDDFGEPIYPHSVEEPEPVIEEMDADPEPEVLEKEPELPWDHGLNSKDKKKKRKEMEAQGIEFDGFGQPIYPEAAKEPETEPEPEPKEDDAWGTWGAKEKKKDKEIKRKPVDATPAPAVESKVKEDGGWGIWGTSSKDKKKKGDDAKKSIADLMDDTEPEAEAVSKSVKEESKTADMWGTWGMTSKEKTKTEEKETKKKGLISPVEEAPVNNNNTTEDDIWGTLTTSKDKKGSKSKSKADVSSPVENAKSKPKTVDDDLADILDDDTWDGLGSNKQKSKEEKGSIWGVGAAASAAVVTTTAKTKREKEKEAKAEKEAEEKAAREAEEEEERLRVEAEEAEAAAKLSKKSKSGKTTKSGRSTKEDVQIDLLDEPVPTPKSTSTKLTKTVSRASDDAKDKAGANKSVSDDYFGDWTGDTTSKRTAGKKSSDSKKEIGRKASTNEIDALADLENDLESPVEDTATSPVSKASKTMSGKTKVTSTIAERIKALETKTDKQIGVAATKSKAAGELQKASALKSAPSPKEEKKTSKTSVASKSTSDKSVKNTGPLSPLPGSFPGAFADDFDDVDEDGQNIDLDAEEEDLLADDPEDSKVAEKSGSESESNSASESDSDEEPKVKLKAKSVPSRSKKSVLATGARKSVKSSSKSIALPQVDEAYTEATTDDKPPTPEDKRPARKERARVERVGNTAGWGFWSAAPPPPKKRDTTARKKEPELDSPPSERKKSAKSPAGFVRPKAAKSIAESEKEEKKRQEASKSSGSDKETTSKKASRPESNRGMSFSQFMMGGPPPSAMRPKASRRSSNAENSRSSSRRPSVDAGIASPPPEVESRMNGKAAKLMGVRSKPERRRSVQDKSKAYVDPYPIGDDDMVMINTKGVRNLASEPRRSVQAKAPALSRRTSTKPRSKTISGDEEVVMVDGPGAPEPIFSGAEDIVHVESPPRLKRGTSVKKTTGFLGGLFGGRRTTGETAQLTDAEDAVLPIRTRGSSARKSRATEDRGFTTDTAMDTDANVEARRDERRSRREERLQAEEDERIERERRRKERRDREQADIEARRSRAQEQARKQQEDEERETRERRERRRQRELEKARLAQEALDVNAATEKRREERRRLRTQLETEAVEPIITKEARQRSYTQEEDDRRRRRERRRPEESRRSSRDPRRSSALVEEYHESRSGRGKGTAPPANKTSSWIDSQKEEPPELPPLEGTVLDPSGQQPRSIEDVDSGSRRRKEKYAGMTEAEMDQYRARRRARRTEKSHSGGSDEREKRRATKEYDAYGDPIKTFDGRPPLMRGDSKRNSFLSKWF